jgi:hypothetical protein
MKAKIMILLAFMSFMGSVYACKQTIIATPDGYIQCITCSGGITYCEKIL